MIIFHLTVTCLKDTRIPAQVVLPDEQHLPLKSASFAFTENFTKMSTVKLTNLPKQN